MGWGILIKEKKGTEKSGGVLRGNGGSFSLRLRSIFPSWKQESVEKRPEGGPTRGSFVPEGQRHENDGALREGVTETPSWKDEGKGRLQREPSNKLLQRPHWSDGDIEGITRGTRKRKGVGGKNRNEWSRNG